MNDEFIRNLRLSIKSFPGVKYNSAEETDGSYKFWYEWLSNYKLQNLLKHIQNVDPNAKLHNKSIVGDNWVLDIQGPIEGWDQAGLFLEIYKPNKYGRMAKIGYEGPGSMEENTKNKNIEIFEDWGSSDMSAAVSYMQDVINDVFHGVINPDTIERSASHVADTYYDVMGVTAEEAKNKLIRAYMIRKGFHKLFAPVNHDDDPYYYDSVHGKSANEEKEGMSEMDSQGYKGVRDEYTLGGPEKTVRPDALQKPEDAVKDASELYHNIKLKTREDEQAYVHHKKKAAEISDKIDAIVQDGGQVGLNDPLTKQLFYHRYKMKNYKRMMGEAAKNPSVAAHRLHPAVGDETETPSNVSLDQLRKEFEQYDYWYMMSDDHRYWMAGEASRRRIEALIKELNVNIKDGMKLWADVGRGEEKYPFADMHDKVNEGFWSKVGDAAKELFIGTSARMSAIHYFEKHIPNSPILEDLIDLIEHAETYEEYFQALLLAKRSHPKELSGLKISNKGIPVESTTEDVFSGPGGSLADQIAKMIPGSPHVKKITDLLHSAKTNDQVQKVLSVAKQIHPELAQIGEAYSDPSGLFHAAKTGMGEPKKFRVHYTDTSMKLLSQRHGTKKFNGRSEEKVREFFKQKYPNLKINSVELL